MQKTAHWLLIIGGLNWLLVGVLGWDIGQLFGGQDQIISRIIYILVGLSALLALKPTKSSTPATPSAPQM
jgi:uncharacterized protein